MRVTTGQLRRIGTQPEQFIADARTAAMAGRGFANAQRQWMQAAWRAYFARDRSPDILWTTFDAKVAGVTVDRRRGSMVAGARQMLAQFLDWDLQEPAPPRDAFGPVRDVPWEGHILAVRRDLVYLTPRGYRIRQVWTERGLGLEHPDAPLMAAATLVCADYDLGSGRSEAIEVWQLRDGARRDWSRPELGAAITRLRARLDAVDAAINS